MSGLDWKKAEEKLNYMLQGQDPELDSFFLAHVVAPLSNRYFNNRERTLRLYNEIMNIRLQPMSSFAVTQTGALVKA